MTFKKKIFVIPAAMFAAISVTGCNGGIKIEEKTINVKLLLGGYGSDWLKNTITNFQNVYKNEGYKINLLTPTSGNDGNSVKNELISGYSKSKVDLYFTGSLKPESVYNSGDVLVEEIGPSVYDQKAIKFDGTEEDKTVREKLDSSFGTDWYQYNGKDYCYFYQRSIGALVVNKDKLAKFGYDYLPTTTNQFMDMIHTIKVKSAPSGELHRIAPLVTVANTGYASVMINSWYSQLAGIDKWDRFWSMKDNGTEMTNDGYEVFNDDELKDAGGLVYETYDFNNFYEGSKNFTIAKAHNYLISNDNGGVFLFDGDWAYNETATDHTEEELKRLAFINVPVNSAVGTKLWKDKIKTGDQPDTEKIDKVLAKVINCSDNGKTTEEAVAAVKSELEVDITTEEAQKVYVARGIYNNRGVETGNAYIAKGIGDTHKDIASKFLRMIASDDFSKMYFSTSKCFSPYSNVIDESETLPSFFQGHKAIATHKNAHAVWPFTSSLRKKIGSELERMFPKITTYFHTKALDSTVTCWDEENSKWLTNNFTEYRKQSNDTITENYNYAKEKWESWKPKTSI